MEEKSQKKALGVVIRGVAMGAADVVPGVSGGTIAFITGIYEELLESISGLNLGLLKTWKKDGFKAMWIKGNFSFLFALFAGIIVSIMSLAVLIQFLLKAYPIQLWAFFFGLIIASVWLVGKTVKKWSAMPIIGLILGAIAAYFITIMAPTQESSNLFYIFISGSIAICAMILPGISGSFILLLLGAYTTILGAVSGMMSTLKSGEWDLFFNHSTIIGVFIAGCLVGLISFSKLLNWLFKKVPDVTVAILTGFLIGSLNKIWPWKETITFFTKHVGEANQEQVPLVQNNVSPELFSELIQKSNIENGTNLSTENHFLISIILALAGIAFIILLDYFGNRKKTA